jgi:hypothetical protein
MSHAITGVLTCARIHSIELDREHFQLPDATYLQADNHILANHSVKYVSLTL